MIEDNIFILAAAATAFAKPLVDIVRIGLKDRPFWVSPALAVLFGFLITLVLLVANGETVTVQLAAQSLLAGILVGLGSVGTTELQRKAD